MSCTSLRLEVEPRVLRYHDSTLLHFHLDGFDLLLFYGYQFRLGKRKHMDVPECGIRVGQLNGIFPAGRRYRIANPSPTLKSWTTVNFKLLQTTTVTVEELTAEVSNSTYLPTVATALFPGLSTTGIHTWSKLTGDCKLKLHTYHDEAKVTRQCCNMSETEQTVPGKQRLTMLVSEVSNARIPANKFKSIIPGQAEHRSRIRAEYDTGPALIS
ncbi:hypothetical protein B0H13DRAFT_1886163 [Mycena leptocephala]|nr:hypothetical protein B0H13DRAFT_1886163 [Mycena leptocephala]